MMVVAFEINHETRLAQRVLSEPNSLEETIADRDTGIESLSDPDSWDVQVEAVRAPGARIGGQPMQSVFRDFDIAIELEDDARIVVVGPGTNFSDVA
jgi:hypothetical protein